MPSGKTHDRITSWGVPVVAAATLGITRDSVTTLAIASGFAIGGFLLSPDLDIHSVPYKRWGPFRWIWLPYRNMFRHRSPWTHGLLVGTTIRVLYLTMWLGMAVALSGAIAGALGGGSSESAGAGAIASVRSVGELLLQQPWLGAIAVGLELGALSHVVADQVGSALARAARRSRKSSSPSTQPPRKRPGVQQRSRRSPQLPPLDRRER